MRIYIVYAHPGRRSFSRSVLEAFTRGLREAGHEYAVADLYAAGFVSEMDEAQYEREVSGDPELPVPPDVAAEQAQLDRADALVLVFPLWWSDCPAKLKGWFDRVFTCGYAYVYDAADPAGGPPAGGRGQGGPAGDPRRHAAARRPLP